MKREIPTPESWIEPLSAYLAWLRGVRRAEGTIYQHSYQLRRFATSTGLDPWPVTTTQLVDHLASLDDRDVGASARRTVRQVLRGFYGWGVIVERWDANPALRIPAINAPRGVARPAPEHSVKVGLHTPDDRTRAMILLAVRCGLRCREIAQVHTRDLIDDLVGHSLVAHGKGDKKRLVPAPPDVVRLIQDAEPGYLFAGRIDGHLSPARVSELISEALPPGVTAHMLRHRYGTRAYHLGGRDLRAVQALLGHAYSTTTEIYVATSDDSIRRAAMAAAAG
uniref:tyrosine-type recombinase/integrase n=1 Tax=Microbacterium proteolyticum TaxID=1572644 RepID=UPI002415F96D|nr:tyrosine-type recombinase/integrase [Microbacterium proteolyticum]